MRFLAYSLKVKRPHSPDAHERGHAKKPKVCYLPVKVNSDASHISITNPSNKVSSIPLTNFSSSNFFYMHECLQTHNIGGFVLRHKVDGQEYDYKFGKNFSIKPGVTVKVSATTIIGCINCNTVYHTLKASPFFKNIFIQICCKPVSLSLLQVWGAQAKGSVKNSSTERVSSHVWKTGKSYVTSLLDTDGQVNYPSLYPSLTPIPSLHPFLLPSILLLLVSTLITHSPMTRILPCRRSPLSSTRWCLQLWSQQTLMVPPWKQTVVKRQVVTRRVW